MDSLLHDPAPNATLDLVRVRADLASRGSLSGPLSQDLIAEVERLSALLKLESKDFTHQCRRCLHFYAPKPGCSEDCPRCGSDGRDDDDMKGEAT